MEIKEIGQKEIWENFLADVPAFAKATAGKEEKTFLQSWNWGEFQKRMGNRIWRLGTYNNNGGLSSVALVVKISAKRGTFLLVQHLSEIREESLKILLEELKKIGKKEKAVFIRVAPLFERNGENVKIFKKLGLKEAPMHANAYEATWKLDIAISEDELMKNMRKTTRYLIRQAMKNPNITIEKSQILNDAEIYQELNKEVAKRQNFTPFSDTYIQNEFEVFLKDDEAVLFFGKYKGEIASAAIIIFWQGIGFYHQAASLAKYAKLSIPYLIQWEAIKEAKNKGCELYDFWGYTDPKKYPKHPWAGPTLFKMGFGGKAYEYIKTQDFALSGRYWLTYFFEKLRKIRTFSRFGVLRTLFPRNARK
ncbi:MAG: peptidoglycan bridge formation glycyltransferase FemA/FemB family protein [Patescibacteria group bacterium]